MSIFNNLRLNTLFSVTMYSYFSRRQLIQAFATQVDQYIHRLLAEEDANNSHETNGELFHAALDAGMELYRMGDFADSQIANFDVYLLKKVQNELFKPVYIMNPVDTINSLFCSSFRLGCFQMCWSVKSSAILRREMM